VIGSDDSDGERDHDMLESDTVLDKAVSLKSAGRPFALVTVVRCESPASAKPGAKAVVEPDGMIHGWVGGGCAQPAVIKVARQALADGRPRLIRISPERNEAVEAGMVAFGMTCHSGGTLDIFIDPVLARPALLIIGTSPAAQALCGLASRVGFAVTVAFPGANAELFPDAVHILDSLDLVDPASVAPAFVVVSTQGKRDEAGLEAALRTGCGYLAFIASERKAVKLRQYLRERGHDPARVQAIESPAGVDIGARTPEEIALSVLAAVVKARRTGATDPAAAPEYGTAARAGEPAETGPGPEGGAVATDPVCGMSVAIGTAAHRSQHAGTTYYFCCAHCQHSFDKEPTRYLEALREAR
jgi:xanthine dehydrogenase accessory factor